MKLWKNKIESILFVGFLLLFSLVVLFKLFKNSNEYNLVDNRMANKFTFPSLKKIISGEYQNSIEEAIADQMPKYNWFKVGYLKIANYLNISTVYFFGLNSYDKYINLGGINLYHDYLIRGSTNEETFISTAKDDIVSINNIKNKTSANVYLYFIENDYNVNFETNYKVPYEKYLKDNLILDYDKISSFKIDSFDTFKNYFYITDHHWNYIGSYKAYKDIASFMNFDYVLEPKNTICFDDIPSYGSKSKSIARVKIFKDIMCMYEFDFPEFQISNSEGYMDDYGGKVTDLQQLKEISYASIYGGDYDELVFINKGKNNNKKLLVYANSYSNAINKLLASNYKETYIIDGRYFRRASMVEYINDKNIDDVLILGNSMLFWDDIKW